MRRSALGGRFRSVPIEPAAPGLVGLGMTHLAPVVVLVNDVLGNLLGGVGLVPRIRVCARASRA